MARFPTVVPSTRSPPKAPGIASFSSASTIGVTITPPQNDGAGISGYVIEQSPDGVTCDSGTFTATTVFSLRPVNSGTLVFFRARTLDNNQALSAYSTVVSAQNGITAPVISLSAPGLQGFQINLDTPSVGQGFSAQNYDLFVSNSGPNGAPVFSQFAMSQSLFPLTISGLQSATTYWARARGNLQVGLNSYTSDFNSPIPSITTNATTGTQKNWNPGQGMSSGVFTRLGSLDGSGNNAIPIKAAEIAILRSGPAQASLYEGYYFWRALDNNNSVDIDASPTGGGLDADYAAVTGYQSGSRQNAVYSNPRHFGIYIMSTDYFSTNPALRCVPDFILSNNTYGVGKDGTRNGYWTTTGSGGTGSGSVIAIYRTAVLNAYKAFFTKLANHVLPDGWKVSESPYVEFIKPYLESAAMVPQNAPNTFGNAADPTYSDNAVLSNLLDLASHLNTTFPITNVCGMVNFLNNVTDPHTLVQGLLSRRNGLSGPDIFGASSGQNVNQTFPNSLNGYTHGQCSFSGLLPPVSGNYNALWTSGGTDLRLKIPLIATVQNTETVPGFGRYFTPLDISNQLNNLKATHACWQYVTGQTGTGATANWFGNAANLAAWQAGGDTVGGVLTTIVNHALINSTYPTGY